MRKRNIDFLFDTIFWYILYSLPFLAYLFQLFGQSPIISLSTFLTSADFLIASDNIVLTTFNGIFGANGILPLFGNVAVIHIFVYFVSVFMCHLLVDFVLFIARLCHKWLKSFTQGD